MADTAKVVVRCTNGRGDGDTRAVVPGTDLGDCKVTAVTGDRKRRSAKIEGAEPRTYRCFAGAEDVCE